MALPKLQRLSEDIRRSRYPDLNLRDLDDHVSGMQDIITAKREAKHNQRQRHLRVNRNNRDAQAILPLSKQPRSRSRTPPTSSRGRSPTRRGRSRTPPIMPDLEKDTSDHDGDPPTDCDEDAESIATVSSDESNASIFGLRGRVYSSDGSWSEGDHSLISDNNEDMDADAEKQLIANWRETHQLQNDNDFAFVCTTSDEAYANAGRAVSTAWSRCRQRSELSLHTDASHILAFKATSEKIKACEKKLRK